MQKPAYKKHAASEKGNREMDLYVQKKDSITITFGYKLQNGLAAHKSLAPGDKSWVVVDIASGLYVKNDMKSLKACQTYALTNPDKDRIEAARKSEFYAQYMKRLAAWKKQYLD